MAIAKLRLKTVQRAAYRLALFPMSVVVVLSILLGLLQDFTTALSTFWGGLVWTIASLMLAYFLFRNTSPRAARRILMTLYMTEMMKLGLITLFIVGASLLTSLSMQYILLGYIVAMVAFWFTPLLVFNKDANYERNHNI